MGILHASVIWAHRLEKAPFTRFRTFFLTQFWTAASMAPVEEEVKRKTVCSV